MQRCSVAYGVDVYIVCLSAGVRWLLYWMGSRCVGCVPVVVVVGGSVVGGSVVVGGVFSIRVDSRFSGADGRSTNIDSRIKIPRATVIVSFLRLTFNQNSPFGKFCQSQT